jgi:hypothetical protein
MTLRRLNIRIQGLPESYASEPYLNDMVIGEPHPLPGPEPLPLYPVRSSPQPPHLSGVDPYGLDQHHRYPPTDPDGVGVTVQTPSTAALEDVHRDDEDDDDASISRSGPTHPAPAPFSASPQPLVSPSSNLGVPDDGGEQGGEGSAPSPEASARGEPSSEEAAEEPPSSPRGEAVPARADAASTPPLTSGDDDDDGARSMPGGTPTAEKKVEDPSPPRPSVVPVEAATTPV